MELRDDITEKTWNSGKKYEQHRTEKLIPLRTPEEGINHLDETRTRIMLCVCNTPDVTCQICNSDSCHFRLCVTIFPPWSGFVFRFAFCHVMHFISCHHVHCICIRVRLMHPNISPLSVLQSGVPISSGAPFLFSFMCVCQTFSEWTEACQVVLLYHPETTGQVSFHSEVVWYSND